MSEYLLRQRLAQSHQEDGPVNGMETHDILSNQMQIRWPQLMILLRAFLPAVITNPRDVVGKGVQPHINHVPVVKVHRNSPFKGSSGNA